jgi:hypothetical protein
MRPLLFSSLSDLGAVQAGGHGLPTRQAVRGPAGFGHQSWPFVSPGPVCGFSFVLHHMFSLCQPDLPLPRVVANKRHQAVCRLQAWRLGDGPSRFSHRFIAVLDSLGQYARWLVEAEEADRLEACRAALRSYSASVTVLSGCPGLKRGRRA